MRNFKHAKIALVAKNIFAILNSDEKHWASIVKFKYGNFDIWDSRDTKHDSRFFKMLSKTIGLIRSNLWINFCNPGTTKFLSDPWIFDIFFAFEPTFLNMDWFIENLSISGFLHENTFNKEDPTACLSHHLDWSILSKNVFVNDYNDHWAWLLDSSASKTSHVIYNLLNHSSCDD